MNIKFMLVADTVAARLTGCATPAEIQQQNDQLLLINVNLQQIQDNQMKVLVLQQAQAEYLLQGNTLLGTQAQLQTLQSVHNEQGHSKAVRRDWTKPGTGCVLMFLET